MGIFAIGAISGTGAIGAAARGIYGSIPFQTENEVIKEWKRKGFPKHYSKAVVEYLKENEIDFTHDSLEGTHHEIEYQIVNKIVKTLIDEQPKSENAIEKVLKRFWDEGHTDATVQVAKHQYLLNKSMKSPSLKERLANAQSNVKSENIIAIKNIIEELESTYIELLKIDAAFMEELLEKRPLVVLTMLTKPKLRELLLQKYSKQLQDYINNEAIYKQLVPYIQIYEGKTHGQWRHLADSKKKTCVVLYMKDCKVASSKNTNTSYERETFLVLEGLSMRADKDSAELHYLEV